MTAALIERGFVRLPAGRVHYRFTAPAQAAAPPLYMAHAGPGCSRGLEPLIAALGVNRRVVAPEIKAEFLARYAPPVSPDDHGGHLAWAWRFVSGLALHFPHYRMDPAG